LRGTDLSGRADSNPSDVDAAPAGPALRHGALSLSLSLSLRQFSTLTNLRITTLEVIGLDHPSCVQAGRQRQPSSPATAMQQDLVV